MCPPTLNVPAAIVLRMIQHVFELFTRLLLAWREENPDLIVPRSREDLRATLFGYGQLLPWVGRAVWTWCEALLAHSLLFVPVAVRDWQGVDSDH